MSMLLIVLGALLVLLGIGAIILILVRRKDPNADDEAEDGDGGPQRGPTPVPASRGTYRGAPADATMVARAPGYGDPTMVGRGNGMGPGMDAPTTMIPPATGPLDEYPDPYGAPPPRSPQPTGRGYGAPQYPAGQQGYPDQQGYDRGYQGQDTGGYGAAGGTMYGGDNGYDERPPAGGYTPPAQRPPSDPYVSPTRQYGGGGYEPQPEPARYPADPPASRGYANQYGGGGTYGDQGGNAYEGYDAPREQPRRGGYEDYEQQPRGGGGYGQQGGYDQQPRGGDYGGYDQGGYDDAPPARHGGGQPPANNYPPPGQDQRRSLDWLDD
jgi:hypothetical protein